jgi:hypothetical protein
VAIVVGKLPPVTKTVRALVPDSAEVDEEVCGSLYSPDTGSKVSIGAGGALILVMVWSQSRWYCEGGG